MLIIYKPEWNEVTLGSNPLFSNTCITEELPLKAPKNSGEITDSDDCWEGFESNILLTICWWPAAAAKHNASTPEKEVISVLVDTLKRMRTY